MKSYIFLAAVCMLFAVHVQAQQNATGQVLDAQTNAPIAGAHLVYGKNLETLTDKNGEFSIPCSGTLNLNVFFEGYRPLEQKMACTPGIRLMLTSMETSLETIEITATSNPEKSQLDQPCPS
ncbi:MAG: carboxypeptidase-like regulatory domain-containing protein [Bacteroidia bacterium]